MPKVTTRKASGRGKMGCIKCGGPIKKGEEYHEWSFFRQSPRRMHAAHGYPRRSQLTGSKMSEVYGAIEAAEDAFDKAKCPEDIASELESVAQTCRDIASEYQEAVDAMGAAGENSENADKVSELESFADDLESKAQDIRDEEPPEEEESDAKETTAPASDGEPAAGNDKAIAGEAQEYSEDFLDDLRQQANDALGELNL